MNHFSLVLGILITIAILLFVLARLVGASTQVHTSSEQLEMRAVDARVRPFAHVAVAGADNSALAALEEAGAEPAAASRVAQDRRRGL